MASRRGTRHTDNGDMVDRYEPPPLPPPPKYKRWLQVGALAIAFASVIVASIASIRASGQVSGASIESHNNLCDDVDMLKIDLKEHQKNTDANFRALTVEYTPRLENDARYSELRAAQDATQKTVETILDILLTK